MKQTNTFIVMRDKAGKFLAKYKNQEYVLAYSSGWTDEIEEALAVPEELYNGRDNERYLAMAMMFNAEPIKVQAEYTLTTLDGGEPAEAEKPMSKEEVFKELLGMFVRGDDDV